MNIKKAIQQTIDIFYPVFKPFMDHQTYRFLACGGINVAVEIVSFFIAFHFIIQKQIIYLPLGLAISPYIGALILSFCIGFPTGFMVMKHIAFPDSNLRGRTQLVRYFTVVMINLLLNYVLLKILVEYFEIYPTPSKIIATGIVVITSYLLQKNFSFKTAVPPAAKAAMPMPAPPTPAEEKELASRKLVEKGVSPLVEE